MILKSLCDRWKRSDSRVRRLWIASFVSLVIVACTSTACSIQDVLDRHLSQSPRTNDGDRSRATQVIPENDVKRLSEGPSALNYTQ